MKKLLLIILGMFLAFGAVYLAGAFAQANFNILKWSEGARTVVAFMGFMCSFFGGVLMAFDFSEENKK
jgi:hypothetical protein